jgi:ParB family transcriptional regulator, chromosome partitioning protein
MSTKKRGLGRGLDALLSSTQAAGVDEAAGDELREVEIGLLVAGAHQPRRHFDEDALSQLADSLKTQGVVQPLVVRAKGRQFEIVAGERRWRAAERAGLKTVPVIVRALSEQDAMTVALVENIQRADLNALEEAEALRKLIDDCGLTHDQCAQAVGRSRAHVSNLLRLLELEAECQALVRSGQLSLGHAKVLLGAEGARQVQLARTVVQRHLSVRQTELLMKAPNGAPAERPVPERNPDLERRLSSALGLPVKLQGGSQGRGKLVISYRDAAELQRLLGALEG